VGYGDISPSFWGTQLLFIGMMLLFLTLLPYKTSALIEALIDHSPYQRAAYSRKPAQSHAIITGYDDPTTLKTALEELLHHEHKLSRVRIVVLSPRPPSTQIKALIASYSEVGSIQYIQGSAINPDVGQMLAVSPPARAPAHQQCCRRRSAAPPACRHAAGTALLELRLKAGSSGSMWRPWPWHHQALARCLCQSVQARLL
jgi:hypothetical protein